MQDIWSAYAGPGIKARGIDSTTWSDQTDMRPTVLALVGLHDDYTGDGRVLIEDLAPSAVSHALSVNRSSLLSLGRVYKQLTAADGAFAGDTLTASTTALNSGSSSNDATYTRIESKLTALDSLRDQLAATIAKQLGGAAFSNTAVSSASASTSIVAADALLREAHALAH
jgi:hypothetical protein